MKRGQINGRHFDLMKRLVGAEIELPESDELTSLVKWGYAVREGDKYTASNAGQIAWDAWNGMEPR